MTQKPRKTQQKYIDLGNRGRYCIHNKLNDLTGKEWIIYSKSPKANVERLRYDHSYHGQELPRSA